ncbi:MAG: hypothetical protein Q7J35_08035 [Candidatus Methanoperedens sp.]|nr:hypothetical protein [Candidatus Methanoperedens sp.]
MDFVSQVRKNRRKYAHRGWQLLDNAEGIKRDLIAWWKAITWEKPDGVRSSIFDDKGAVVGSGDGITWPPEILFALIGDDFSSNI